MWFVEGYLIAVCGSFVVRFLVLLARFSFTEILQELRLGWKDYLKEDICWGGLAGLKYLFCFRLVGLENRDDRIRNLFLSHVRQRYPIPNDWRKRVRMDELPKEVKERALAMANAELSHELKLDEIEAIVRRVEQGKRVVRRASLATCLATWVASPLKMVTQLICSELPVAVRVCCATPLAREKVVPRMQSILPRGDETVLSGEYQIMGDWSGGSHHSALPCALIIEPVIAFVDDVIEPQFLARPPNVRLPIHVPLFRLSYSPV